MPNLPGVSAGRRWIEIYNPSVYPYSLNRWQIQTAGNTFTTVFTFSDVIIQPDEYIVIGENQVEFADYRVSNLNLQAGMNNTVGARIVSNDGRYKDTVLYSSPNNNNLPDDVDDPAINFAPRPPEGRSLARKPNGYDSNSVSDWSIAETPTPKGPNFIYFDLAIIDLYITESRNNHNIHIVIHDLSTDIVDKSLINLQVILNENIIYDTTPNLLFINNIADFTIEVNLLLNSMNYFKAEINYPQDVDISNNIKHFGYWYGFKPLIINEIQFQPLTSEPEWIEFFNRSDDVLIVQNAFVMDAAGAIAYFSAVIEPQDYLIITQNKDLFEDAHPFLDLRKVIQTNTWAVLNNTAETIELFFDEYTKIDSVSYVGVSSMRGRSLERVNPWLDDNVQWAYNMTEIGSSPLSKNSQTPADIDAKINSVNIFVQGNFLEHRISIENIGLTSYIEADLLVYHRHESMLEFEYLDEIPIFITDELEEMILTLHPTERGYHYYMYKLIFGNENDQYTLFFLHENPPAVINEIMFQPFTGEPIWVEFFKLRDSLPVEGLKFFARTDSIHIPHWEGDFALLTTNAVNIIFMRDNYDIPENIPIFTGLRTLLNAGQELLLKDYDNNIYEEFAYTPAFSVRRGESAERISPILPPNVQNWTGSLVGSTPGRPNSVFMNLIPTISSLEIENNPFSPYRGEHSIIMIKVAEQRMRADVRVFDIKGREIIKLADKMTLPGEYSFIWNGFDDNNNLVRPGVYPLYVNIENMEGHQLLQTRKLIYVGR
ncbi:MAG: lamin tail domain-containing protein [Candidatus Cloacimonetes bacterium]|nr:lamin tail domain-containing protein [Candidatus Cloacimonadota bacterium]